MYQSLYKRPSVATIIDEQQRYSIQQMHKIQQSNHKLDQLEEKMKSLLQKDNRRKQHQNISQPITDDFPQDNQLFNRYSQSLKKRKMTVSDREQPQNDDMLLENHSVYDNFTQPMHKNVRQSCVSQTQKYSVNPHHQPKEVVCNNRQKSNTSLKIFKKSQFQDNKSIQNNSKPTKRIDNQSSLIHQNSEFQIFNQTKFPYQQHSDQINPKHNNPLNLFQNNRFVPQFHLQTIQNSDVLQINQLEQMMEKSVQIKEKQLALGQQELQTLQKLKIQEYRKNMDLQIELQKIKKLSNQVKFNPTIKSKSQQQQQIPPSSIKIIQQISSAKQQINFDNQKLLAQLKKLQEQEYNLKLQKKKITFQLGSMQRQFNKILKARTNRMKQNIQQNYQQLQNDNEKYTDRLLGRKNQSVKTLKTNKKHSISNFEVKTQTDREKTGNKNFHTHNIMNKSKEKFTTPIHEKNQSKNHKVSKSTSCSAINRNRHTLAECQQSNKNCETDKILFSMVHELDKLKQIVNKQIVRTKAKNNQRRAIQLYDSKRISKQKIGMMR